MLDFCCELVQVRTCDSTSANKIHNSLEQNIPKRQ